MHMQIHMYQKKKQNEEEKIEKHSQNSSTTKYQFAAFEVELPICSKKIAFISILYVCVSYSNLVYYMAILCNRHSSNYSFIL